jgi:predicted nucleotidyltransferase component of viral defense system
MSINIYNKLKRRIHKDIALLQDQVVDLLYDIFPDLVFHGGTCIWRCYNGNRFSEDLDFYIKDQKNIKLKLEKKLKTNNLKLIKFKKTGNVIFSKISDNNVQICFKARILDKNNKVFSNKININYNKVDGSFIIIYSLNKEDLILEKAKAFLDRRLIRDIYDIYFLSFLIKDHISKELKLNINELIKDFKPPKDSKTLKTIVYSGIAPKYTVMLNIIKNRFR